MENVYRLINIICRGVFNLFIFNENTPFSLDWDLVLYILSDTRLSKELM